MKAIKSFHNGNKKTARLIYLYNAVLSDKTSQRMIIQLDEEGKYYMVDLGHDDGTPLADGIVCLVTNSGEGLPDEFKEFTDHLEALQYIRTLLDAPEFREAYVESF